MTTSATDSAVIFEKRGNWASATLNRPDMRNPLTADIVGGLMTAFAEVANDDAIRGMTLQGNGKVFSAGADLKNMRSQAGQEQRLDDIIEGSLSMARLLQAIRDCPKVIIARVHGAAVAGGMGITCAADVSIADKDSVFALTETRIGLSPAQIAPYVIARVGCQTARRLMLTGERFKAPLALQMGIIDKMTSDAHTLDDLEREIKNAVLKCAPDALRHTKTLLHHLATPNLHTDDTASYLANNFAECVLSEAKEGVAAFLEKRDPSWSRAVE